MREARNQLDVLTSGKKVIKENVVITGIFKKIKEKRMPGAGLEPAQRKPPRDFKSLASTNSATPAV
jgi:hypothetical protein